MIKFSAPGKIHLLGEHSVVYGKPAILAAINLRTNIIISAPKSRTFNTTIVASYGVIRKVVESVVSKRFKIKKLPSYQLKIESDIPIGSGLGSSAAVSAAYIGALLDFLQIRWDLGLINELAFEAEKVFHGNPSGGDNTTVVFGGLIWYQKGIPFTPLPFKIHKNIKPFYLIDSGKPIEATGEMITKVNSKFKVQSSKLMKIFNHQGRLVEEMAQALKDGDEEKLIQVIKAGEKNLEKLGVVGKKAKEIIGEVEKSGGAAKILGGGGFKEGSGMILCYYKNLKKAPDKKMGEIKIGGKGLTTKP